MRRMDKKGDGWKVIFTIILCLVVLGIILWGIVPAIRDFFTTTKGLQNCSGMGFAKGFCVVSEGDCTGGSPFPGLGCSGKIPICCLGAEVDEESASCEGSWNDCNKCKVAVTELVFDPMPKLNQKFNVICATNVMNVPCLNAVTITNSANPGKTGTCNLVKEQSFNINTKIFECPILASEGEYTFTCSLIDSGIKEHSCCIEGDNAEAKVKNKAISKTIHLYDETAASNP